MDRLEPGQQIETTIVAVTKECIFLDLNAKSEGILDRSELADEEGNVSVKEGDKIKVYFIGLINGEMKFTTKISGDKADKTMLENAFKNGVPIEGHVEKEIKGGFEIKIGDSRAFCPYSQMGYKEKESPEFYVGRNITFKIQEFKENGRNILVSNRVIGEEEYNQKLDGLKDKLKEGMTVHGTVESLQKFGAFVDIGGFRALLPISEISRDRIDDVSSVLKEGQEIDAKILKVDWQNERISISLKSLLADPWDTAAEKYPVGTKLTGKISRIADFGLFIEMESGLDGLVHISELANLDGIDRNTNLRKKFKTGDTFDVIVKEVNVSQKRLSLKPATSNQQDIDTAQYMKSHKDDDDAEMYNPFAALLKKK